jgi:peptidoglycan hydrolase-like protein with peptidoglycan-binding domain
VALILVFDASDCRPRGAAVVRAQRRLAALGYLEHGSVDGVFGEETWHAVVAFQGWEQLSRDGLSGRRLCTRFDTRTDRARGFGFAMRSRSISTDKCSWSSKRTQSKR